MCLSAYVMCAIDRHLIEGNLLTYLSDLILELTTQFRHWRLPDFADIQTTPQNLLQSFRQSEREAQHLCIVGL